MLPLTRHLPKHRRPNNDFPSQLPLMLHQQIHSPGSTRRPQQREQRICLLAEDSRFADFAVDEPLDDGLGGGVWDGVVGDEAQVFDVAPREGGDGLPDCEGDVGPVEGFGGGAAGGEGGDEAVAGGVFVVESGDVFPGDPVWIGDYSVGSFFKKEASGLLSGTGEIGNLTSRVASFKNTYRIDLRSSSNKLVVQSSI